MTPDVRWKIALISPGERDVGLLANLSQRRDVTLVGVVDATGEAVGSALAEVMELPVFRRPDAPDLKGIDYLVYPALGVDVAPLLAEAEKHGIRTMSGREFEQLLPSEPIGARVKTAPPVSRNYERLERETESIYRTLRRMEEALRRESLLRWLLSLATRAVGASGGSIMLFDEKTSELYIAFAYGLSEATVHRTRVTLGDGIAGRVAERLRSEMVQGQITPDDTRDRPDIIGAISAPLVWEERLLGVLNVSVVQGDAPLTEEDLAVVDRLARRLGMVLYRYLDIQRAQAGEIFRQTDQQLQDLMQKSHDLSTILSAWAGTLALGLQSERLSLAVVCGDGSLLVAEGMADGGTSVRYEMLADAAWGEVLETGHPLVVRQAGPDAGRGHGLTIFTLPIGKSPVRAVLTVVYGKASEAHRFHDASGEIMYLLEKRLVELIGRVCQQDKLERLTALATAVGEIAALSRSAPTEAKEKLLSAARELTGAQQVYWVEAIVDEQAEILGPDAPTDAEWLRQAARLVKEAEAEAEGWRITLLSDSSQPRLTETCLLAVTGSDSETTPALLMAGKERLHRLDGGVFTEFDADLARRLARLLPICEAPPFAESAPATPLPATESVGAVDAATPPTTSSRLRENLVLDILRREMDRCDRYHTAFALMALRPQLPAAAWNDATALRLLEAITAQVRTSDVLACLPDGTILLMAPEDVQATNRLRRRMVSLLGQFLASSDTKIAVSHTIYPGRHDDAGQLLAETLASLQNAS